MGVAAKGLAIALGSRAEAVCRFYLWNGRRAGDLWQVGDIRNSPGRTTLVRLHPDPDGIGRPGRWTDTATGASGDLLDVIRASRGLADFRDVLAEARRFLDLPCRPATPAEPVPEPTKAALDAMLAARRLFTLSRPIAGTPAEIYLRGFGLTRLRDLKALRFHPVCHYRAGQQDRPGPEDRAGPGAQRAATPALIAAVTDIYGTLTGIHRTWLQSDGSAYATVDPTKSDLPKPGLGKLLANAVRFAPAGEVMAVGAGIETVLALREVLPLMPMAATLSDAHLAAFEFPEPLRRLYILRGRDARSDACAETLLHRAGMSGIEATILAPEGETFCGDLRADGPDRLRYGLRRQLSVDDVLGFIETGCAPEIAAPPAVSFIHPGLQHRAAKSARRRRGPQTKLRLRY